MKNILVPTDFSKLSHHALDLAVQLAKPIGAQITLLHLEEVPLGDLSLHLTGEAKGSELTDDALYNAQLFRANNLKIFDLVEEFSSEGVEITGTQYGGGFLTGIQHYVKKNGTDLVVIGTTGEESIQEFFSGNHTEQLIEHLDVPVLSVQDKQYHKIEDIVLGLDIEDQNYTKSVFDLVKKVVDPLKARLHIIDIAKTYDAALENKLDEIAKFSGLSNYLIDVVEDKKANEALLDYAEGTDAGLIVVITEAQGGLSRFFQHSFAAKLTKKSSIPVLTINKKYITV